MAHAPDQQTTLQEEEIRDAQPEDASDSEADPGAVAPASTSTEPAASPVTAVPETPPAVGADPEASAAPTPPAAQPGNLAELSARLRQEAAEITEIAAQAGRLGIAIDAAKALREGPTPEALRSLVLERASAAADARDVVAAPSSPASPQATESPLITAAKRDAAAGKRS
jgi:hypothetical protein